MRSLPADAFGEAIRQFHVAGSAQMFVERSDGVLDAHDPATYFAGYEDWRALDRALIEKVVGRALDIGCGAGRHALYLQDRGIEVLAVDSSPGCIAVAAARGLMHTQILRIEHIQQVQNPPYESVLLMGANYGLLGSRAKAKRILDALDSVTVEGARIIGTTNEYPATDNPVHLAYHAYNRRRRRLQGTVTIRIRWRELIGEWFDYVFFTEEDLKKVLRGTRWELQERIPGAEGAQVGYVIRKSGNA